MLLDSKFARASPHFQLVSPCGLGRGMLNSCFGLSCTTGVTVASVRSTFLNAIKPPRVRLVFACMVRLECLELPIGVKVLKRVDRQSIRAIASDMKVAIATPTHDGNVTYEYLYSLRALESDFRKNQIQSDLITLEGTTLAFARNAFASIVMNDKSYTHLLFVDADMGFMPEAVMKLIRSGHSVTGCVCPARQLNLVKFHAASRSVPSPEQAQLFAAEFAAAAALEKNDRGQYVVKDGFVRTRRIGMGITLIRREALEELALKLPELVSSSEKDRYYAKAVNGPVLQCFAHIYADGVLSSEDASFCKRWIQCGGEIWALIDQTVVHVGRYKFLGNFSKSMQVLASAPSDLPAPPPGPSGDSV